MNLTASVECYWERSAHPVLVITSEKVLTEDKRSDFGLKFIQQKFNVTDLAVNRIVIM